MMKWAVAMWKCIREGSRRERRKVRWKRHHGRVECGPCLVTRLEVEAERGWITWMYLWKENEQNMGIMKEWRHFMVSCSLQDGPQQSMPLVSMPCSPLPQNKEDLGGCAERCKTEGVTSHKWHCHFGLAVRLLTLEIESCHWDIQGGPVQLPGPRAPGVLPRTASITFQLCGVCRWSHLHSVCPGPLLICSCDWAKTTYLHAHRNCEQ